MKVLYTGFRDHNHSKSGGYDHITKYPESYFLSAEMVPFGFIPLHRRGKRINIYFLDIVSRFLRHKYDILHLILGDDLISETQILFPYNKSHKNKVVATIHLNIQEIPIKKINVLKKLDGVIVLSNEQCLLARRLGSNAHFIPHGFNRPAYNFILPEQNNEKLDDAKINIFFSGNNYRDYNMLYYFLDLIKKRNDIVVHALGQKNDEKQRLIKFDNVLVYDRLSDDKYFSLLSICDYNFLPLTFATANNALMEAQSLGIRSIVSDIDGIGDYANREENILFKNRQDIIEIISKLQKNTQCEAIKEYSKNFFWDCIYTELEKFYKNLFQV